MKRLDHSMIFVFIAGSYTPFARLALPQNTGVLLFWIVWGGALAGVALKMCWPSAPRWVGVPLYLLLGWVAVWFAPTIMHGAGVAAMVLLAVGGALLQHRRRVLRAEVAQPVAAGRSATTSSSTPAPRSRRSCHYIAMWFAVFYVG